MRVVIDDPIWEYVFSLLGYLHVRGECVYRVIRPLHVINGWTRLSKFLTQNGIESVPFMLI